MRLHALWFLGLSNLLVTSNASAQFSMSTTADTTSYTFTFSAGPPMPSLGIVSGAPYSGRQTSENVQTLADGTRLTRGHTVGSTVYRDSAGRMRRERSAFGTPTPGLKPPASFAIVEVDDPIAGFRYLFDAVNQVAHRMPLQVQPMPNRPQTAPPPRASVPTTLESTTKMSDGTVRTFQSLGTQVIAGVTAQGTRNTTTYPAGSYMGNDRPVTTVSENWVHPETRAMLLSKMSSPIGGDSTMTMEDFSTNEPDPALFEPPPGYKIVDETGPFKIVIPREPQTR